MWAKGGNLAFQLWTREGETEITVSGFAELLILFKSCTGSQGLGYIKETKDKTDGLTSLSVCPAQSHTLGNPGLVPV